MHDEYQIYIQGATTFVFIIHLLIMDDFYKCHNVFYTYAALMRFYNKIFVQVCF